MAESLNVISLISGGKDSFFSILHCMRNGHKVVALANLYPVTPPSKPNADAADGREETEQDLNSFMFQTVGHTVIPLYEQALGIPLYRQPIIGSAVQTGASYSHYRTPEASSVELEDGAADETESLVPLLKKIISEHPSVQAISTGAILSTYQRTRVESVALRLGLTPLSYLWKYPVLPPGIQTSLLEDMQAAGLDARIVKVASGGLDESFLWQNVASGNVVRRIERAMGRFGADGDGAVLGEGGEFETLVVDGPRCLFKKRIKVQDGDWRVVREGGGSAWLRLLGAELMVKAPEATTQVDCRIPELLDQRFEDILDTLHKDNLPDRLTGAEAQTLQHIPPYDLPSHLPLPAASEGDVLYWTITSSHSCQDISDEAGEIVAELRQYLNRSSLQASDIISTTIILRSMQDFQVVNQVYGALFIQPNPPARVTISCGEAMPGGINIIIHLKISTWGLHLRKALHVQSRSYWAPANIGPYSQAISISHSTPPSSSSTPPPWTVHVAGQIPLIPSSMLLAPASFPTHTVLALQHLFRIGADMQVRWWTSAVAYLPRSPPSHLPLLAVLAGRAWTLAHRRADEDESRAPDRDLWEEKHGAGPQHSRHVLKTALPDWECVQGDLSAPPFFAVEVQELPRGSGVEWHAQVGVAGGTGVEVSKEEREWGVVYRCAVEGRVYLVVMVLYAEIGRKLEEVLAKEVAAGREYAAYWDVSLGASGGELLGMIPCRSIWDAGGRRLGAVLLYDMPRT